MWIPIKKPQTFSFSKNNEKQLQLSGKQKITKDNIDWSQTQRKNKPLISS